MFVVFAYDIPNNKRRTKVMKMLEGYGEHVQESVFECDLQAATYRQLRQRLNQLLNLSRIICASTTCARRMYPASKRWA